MKIMTMLWIFVAAFTFMAGFTFGMMTQQIAIRESAIEVLSSLEGVEINVDINETYLMDRTEQMTKDIVNEFYNTSNVNKADREGWAVWRYDALLGGNE